MQIRKRLRFKKGLSAEVLRILSNPNTLFYVQLVYNIILRVEL